MSRGSKPWCWKLARIYGGLVSCIFRKISAMVKVLSKWEAISSSSLTTVLMNLKSRPANRQGFDANSNTFPTLLKTFTVAGERGKVLDSYKGVCGIVKLPFELQVFLIPEWKISQVYKTTFVIIVVLRFPHLSSLFSRLRNPSLLTTRIFFIYLCHTRLQHLPLILTSCSVPCGTPL